MEGGWWASTPFGSSREALTAVQNLYLRNATVIDTTLLLSLIKMEIVSGSFGGNFRIAADPPYLCWREIGNRQSVRAFITRCRSINLVKRTEDLTSYCFAVSPVSRVVPAFCLGCFWRASLMGLLASPLPLFYQEPRLVASCRFLRFAPTDNCSDSRQAAIQIDRSLAKAIVNQAGLAAS
jgi:hypothetical protein